MVCFTVLYNLQVRFCERNYIYTYCGKTYKSYMLITVGSFDHHILCYSQFLKLLNSVEQGILYSIHYALIKKMLQLLLQASDSTRFTTTMIGLCYQLVGHKQQNGITVFYRQITGYGTTRK